MTKLLVIIALIIGGAATVTLALMHVTPARTAAQRAVLPGDLSKAHAFLENKCSSCHTAVKGVEAKNCIVCHADNKAVLQREPTAFHADIGDCAECHFEHQGRVSNATTMDHLALAQIGVRQLQNVSSVDHQKKSEIIARLKDKTALAHSPPLQREESLLNCVTCHRTKDRHVGFFGADCAQCHGTTAWSIPEFRHPSATSRDCAQCHQAPPSHYMMHFEMVSMKVAGIEHADVRQCFLCHQTTSWNDIKGIGFYKHH